MNRIESQQRWSACINKPVSGLGATKATLRRFLRSIDCVGWSRREESGRIDRRALTRFAVGDANIFSRREYAEAETSAVSILVDVSSSTNYMIDYSKNIRRCEVFQEIAIHLSKLISDAGCSVAVTGFSGSRIDTSNGAEDHVSFTALKDWGESISQAAPAIASITDITGGGTPEYHSIRLAIEEVSKRPEHRKVLFILTDADDFDFNGAQYLGKVAEKLGVVIVAIGCGDADITKCFTNAARVTNAADVFTASFNNLLRSLRK